MLICRISTKVFSEVIQLLTIIFDLTPGFCGLSHCIRRFFALKFEVSQIFVGGELDGLKSSILMAFWQHASKPYQNYIHAKLLLIAPWNWSHRCQSEACESKTVVVAHSESITESWIRSLAVVKLNWSHSPAVMEATVKCGGSRWWSWIRESQSIEATVL